MFHRWDKVVIPEVGFLFLAKQNTGHLHQNTLLWPHQLKLFLTRSLTSCTGFIFVTIVSQHRPDWRSGTVITATLRQAFNSGFICYNSDTHHSLTRRYTHHVSRVVRRQWRHHNTLLKLRHKYSLQYAPDTSALVQEDKKHGDHEAFFFVFLCFYHKVSSFQTVLTLHFVWSVNLWASVLMHH